MPISMLVIPKVSLMQEMAFVLRKPLPDLPVTSAERQKEFQKLSDE